MANLFLVYRTEISAAIFISKLITQCGAHTTHEWRQLKLLNSQTEDYMKPAVLERKKACVDSLLFLTKSVSSRPDEHLDDEQDESEVIPEAEQILEDALLSEMREVEV